jgi:hypothetical protein
MKKILIILIGLLLLSCDRTVLEGDILPQVDTFKVNQMIPLVLQVPEELEEIHRTMWHIDYEGYDIEDMKTQLFEGEEILDILSEEEIKDLFNLEEINYDRIALFIPNQATTYVVIVDGFFRQTNPQGITSLEIKVNE